LGLKSREFFPDFLQVSAGESLLAKKKNSDRSALYEKLMAFDDFLHFHFTEVFKKSSLQEQHAFKSRELSLSYLWFYLYFFFVKNFFFHCFFFLPTLRFSAAPGGGGFAGFSQVFAIFFYPLAILF